MRYLYAQGCFVPGLHPPPHDFGGSVCPVSSRSGAPPAAGDVHLSLYLAINSVDDICHANDGQAGRDDISLGWIASGIPVFASQCWSIRRGLGVWAGWQGGASEADDSLPVNLVVAISGRSG